MTDQTPPEPSFEYQKWSHEMKREDWKRHNDQMNAFVLKHADIVTQNADSTLKTAILINGGAAVSLLAFAGGLVAQKRAEFADIVPVANGIVIFGGGVAAALVAMGLSYITNYLIVWHLNSHTQQWEPPYRVAGKYTRIVGFTKGFFHLLAILFTLGSLGCFVFGAYSVRAAIIQLGSPQSTPEIPKSSPQEVPAPPNPLKK